MMSARTPFYPSAVFWALLAVGLLSTTVSHAVPKYGEYASVLYDGKRASDIEPSLDTVKDPDLRKALSAEVNFNGRYVFVEKGAGKGCASGAIVDVKTGSVHALPFATCGWSKRYDRPFEFRATSGLFIFAGRLGETGPEGAHFFNFDGYSFQYITSRLATGEDFTIAELVTDGSSVEPADGASAKPAGIPEELEEELARVLVLALLRPKFSPSVGEILDDRAAATILAMSKVLLATSVRQTFSAGGAEYDLYYNSMADIFMLLRHDGENVGSFGLVSAATIAERLYEKKNGTNIFSTLLVERPVLVKAFTRDLPRTPNFERIFSSFLLDEKESLLVQDSLISIQKLLRIGAKDPCSKAVISYVQSHPLTYNGKPLPKGSKVYTSYGFPTPEGRVLAFADENSNRLMGFALFDASDVKSCQPKHVVTSSFDL